MGRSTSYGQGLRLPIRELPTTPSRLVGPANEIYCKTLEQYFSKKTFGEVSPMLIEKFKKERRESLTIHDRQRSPASVNRELEVLSRILSMAVDNYIIKSNPARKVKKLRLDNMRKRYLTLAEEQRL